MKILFVDDDEMVRYALVEYLRRLGHDVTEADNGRKALTTIQTQTFDLVITDIIMPEVEGVELTIKLRESFPDLPIIVISGGGRVGRDEYLTIARDMGANATLTKPVDMRELGEVVESLLGNSEEA